MRSLLLFTSPTCISCPAFKTLVLDVAKTRGMSVELVDVSEDFTRAQELGVRSVPTLFVFKDGVPVSQSGVIPRSRLLDALGD